MNMNARDKAEPSAVSKLVVQKAVSIQASAQKNNIDFSFMSDIFTESSPLLAKNQAMKVTDGFVSRKVHRWSKL